MPTLRYRARVPALALRAPYRIASPAVLLGRTSTMATQSEQQVSLEALMREIAALRNENEQLNGGGHAAGIQTPARPGNAQHSPPTTMTPAAGTGLITPQLQPFGQLDMAKTGLVRLAEPYVQGGWRQYEVSGEDSDLQRQAKALLNKWSRESLFGNDQDCWETTATTRSTPTSGASCRRRMSSVAGLQVLACVAPRAH